MRGYEMWLTARDPGVVIEDPIWAEWKQKREEFLYRLHNPGLLPFFFMMPEKETFWQFVKRYYL